MFRLVDVEFVIVPLVAFMFESDRFPAERVVIVALVRVALVPVIFAPAIFPVEVIFETVVEARVDDPETFRSVMKAVVNERIFPRIFETVVDPRVEEPVVKRLPKAPIPVFVEEPMFSEITFPFWPTKFASVVDARVVEPAVRLVML